MNDKVNFILGASAHLPIGAAESEFESLYNREIRPLIQALNKFPQINMVFHYSGVVLNWIERRYPELFMLIEDLLSRKQIEFLGGGFYSPVLPLLPLTDKIGQIEMLTTYLRKQFGRRPLGCWLPAMTWEQNLVGPLNLCGMGFTFLEDMQFLGAGEKPNEGGIFSPCITEDQGKLITVFPVAMELGKKMRDSSFGSGHEKAGELLKNLPAGEYTVSVFPFQGKSGFSDEQSYIQFFEELLNTDSRIEFSNPTRVFKNLKNLNKIYFPGVWMPGHNSTEPNPRRFLANHPEANAVYSKMVHVHSLINNQLRGDIARKRTAREELWKAQDSSLFRLGYDSSPGLRNSPVRKAAYRSLLEAEKITREKGNFTPSLSFFDYDLDGEGEFIYQDEKVNCFIKSRGAGIFELDYLPAAWNYLDTVSQGKRRSAFTDWFGPANTLPGEIGQEGIPGGFCCGNEEYEVSELDRVRRRLSFNLRLNAIERSEDTGFYLSGIEMEKVWLQKKSSIYLEYKLKNSGVGGTEFIFSPQIDLSFPGEGENFFRIQVSRNDVKESVAYNGPIVIPELCIVDLLDITNEVIITLESSRNFDGRFFNIKENQEYQSTCFMPVFSVKLEPGETWKTAFELKISS